MKIRPSYHGKLPENRLMPTELRKKAKSTNSIAFRALQKEFASVSEHNWQKKAPRTKTEKKMSNLDLFSRFIHGSFSHKKRKSKS